MYKLLIILISFPNNRIYVLLVYILLIMYFNLNRRKSKFIITLKNVPPLSFSYAILKKHVL